MSFLWFAVGMLALVPVLTVQQRQIRALRRSRQGPSGSEENGRFAQELIEAIPCPVFFKGLDGRYLDCNSAFAEYIGRCRDEIVGHTLNDLAPRELVQRYAADDAALLARTGTQVCGQKVRCAAGVLRDVVVRKATFENADGTVGGIIGVIMDVSERKCADHMLRQSEQPFHSLAEHIPANVLRFDRQARVLYMNPALAADLAPEILPVVGKSHIEAHPGNQWTARHQRDIEQVIATGIPAEFDLPFPNARGEIRLHHIRYVAERGTDGQIIGALAIGYDITEHKRAAAFEQFRSRTLELLSGGESLQAVLEGIVQGVGHLGGELDFSILLLDRQGEGPAKGIEASLPDCCKAAIDGIERDPGAGGWRLVAATAKPLVAEDGKLDSASVPAEEFAARADFGVCRSVPIRSSAGDLLGVFAGYCREGYLATEFDAAIIGEAARLASLAIERSRAEAALRASEREFRNLAEHLPDYIARYDREGRWVYLNRLLSELLGIEARDVLGVRAQGCGGPNGNSAYLKCLENVLRTGQPAEIDITWPDTGSGVRYHNIRFIPERGLNGEIVGALSIGRDVTERQQIQRQMEIQTAALNNSNDALFLLDDTLRFVYVNDTACRSLGYSREELLTMRPFDIDPNVTPEIARAIQTEVEFGVPPPQEFNFRHHAKDGDAQPVQIDASLFELIDGMAPPAEFETYHRAKDGRIFPVEICASSFRYEGRTYGLSVVRDITERKRYQESLSAREREFRSLAENAPDNIVRFDRKGRILYANPRLERTMAIAAADMVGKMPQDLVPTWDNAVVDAVLANGEPVEIDFAVPDHHGIARQYQIRLVAERACQGDIVGVLGIGRDVTKRKRVQRDLLILSKAINNASDGIFLVDLELRFAYVNDRACHALGYSRSELLQMGTADIVSETVQQEILRIREHMLSIGSVVRMETQGLAADGRSILVDVTVSMVDYESERMALVVARDITERKRMEDALRHREEEFRSLAENLPDIVMRYDLDCRHIYVNPAYMREVDAPEHEVLLAGPDTRHWRSSSMSLDQYHARLLRVMSTGEPEDLMMDWTRSDGVAAKYAMRIVAERAGDGRVIGALCIGRNVIKLVESERRLEESRRQLRDLAARSEDTREEERRHIAREIHDELGQQLSALRFKLGLLTYDFGGELPQLRDAVINLMSSVSIAIQTTREVSSALRPAVLDMGIVPALEWLIAEYAQRGRVSFKLMAKPDEVRMNNACTVALFRVVQESLTNAVRHSKANLIDVILDRQADAYVVEVRDNGIGFDPDAPRDRRSVGLVGMRERALAVGGELAVVSAVGQGTVLRIRIPVEAD